MLTGQLNAVLRSAARLVLRLPCASHITFTSVMKLHWLEFPARVSFKLDVLAYRCMHGLAPPYLARSYFPVSLCAGRSHLRSAATRALVVLPTRTVTLGPRTFAVSCPTLWNTFPNDLHDNTLSLTIFRKRLKAFLFKPWVFVT